MYQCNYVKNLNEEIDKANGAIQHSDQVDESNSAVKSTTQGIADHNFLIKTISSGQAIQYTPSNCIWDKDAALRQIKIYSSFKFKLSLTLYP